MAERQVFEGLEIKFETIKLKSAWVEGLGVLRIGDHVRIEGIAKCIGVNFEKVGHAGVGQRVHTIAAVRVTATELLGQDTLEELGL